MQMILSEPLREPDNHNSGDSIALLSGVPCGTSDKIYYLIQSDIVPVILKKIL